MGNHMGNTVDLASFNKLHIFLTHLQEHVYRNVVLKSFCVYLWIQSLVNMNYN